MTPGVGWQPSDEFLTRVKTAYRAALAGNGRPSIFSLWRKISDRQIEIHKALMADDNADLRRTFSDPGTTDLFYGIDNLCRSLLRNGAFDEGCLAAQAHSLAAAASIEGFEFPNPFAGEIGMVTRKGVASYRAVLAAAQAKKLKELDARRVLEIGPGMGRTALHARQIGIRDYTTVDLPMGMVAQACFLGAALGSDEIWFATDNVAPGDRIRILSYADLARERHRYDLALNVDSLVEMDPITALKYGYWIRRHSDVFLSINRDYRRMKVKYVAAACFPRARVTRSLWPLRPGYREEIYSIRRSSS